MDKDIIDLASYRQELEKEQEEWRNYKNDGTTVSMLVESASRSTQLIGRLLTIAETQQGLINDLAQAVEKLTKGE